MQPEFSIDDPNHEQRRNRRADLFQEIACEGDGLAAYSQVADISVGGMFIDLYQTPFPRPGAASPPGSRCGPASPGWPWRPRCTTSRSGSGWGSAS